MEVQLIGREMVQVGLRAHGRSTVATTDRKSIGIWGTRPFPSESVG